MNSARYKFVFVLLWVGSTVVGCGASPEPEVTEAEALPSEVQSGAPAAADPKLPPMPPVDPATDPVLIAIRQAVSPDEEQFAAIIGHYETLRQRQEAAFKETMVRLTEERRTESGTDRDLDRDGIMLRVFDLVEEHNRDFLAASRFLLNAEQQPLWDACEADLQLQPYGNFPAGMGGNIDPAKEGPQEGAPAPSFALTALDGPAVALEDLRGKPVVVEFGSLTCPMFRGKVDDFRALRAEFGERVHWLVVYTGEAHATGTPREVPVNAVEGILVPAHGDFDERLSVARRTYEDLDLGRRVLVDTMDDAVTEAWGGFPNWGFVIDGEGVVAKRMVWSDPGQVRRVLERLLNEGI